MEPQIQYVSLHTADPDSCFCLAAHEGLLDSDIFDFDNCKRCFQMQRKRQVAVDAESAGQTTFVTFSHPSQFKSQRTRHVVRSYVTTRQHQEARSKVARRTGSKRCIDITCQNEHTDSPSPSDPNAETLDVGSSQRWREHPKSTTRSSSATRRQKTIRAAKARNIPMNHTYDPESDASSEDMENTISCQSTTLEQPVSEICSLTEASVRSDSVLGSLYDFMLNTWAPLGWSALDIVEDEAAAAEQYLARLCRREPTVRNCRLLAAAGHLAHFGMISQEVCALLTQNAITSMFEALGDVSRKDMNGPIIATGFFAFYECVYGDREMAQVHRAASRRMIASRGGLDALDIPSALKYWIKWADTMVSVHRSEMTTIEGPEISRSCIGEAQCLHALSKWLPDQYNTLMCERNNRSNAAF